MQLFCFTNLQLIPQFKSSLLILASSVLADSEPRVSPGFCQAGWLPSPLQLPHNIFQTVVSSICFTCQLAHIHFPTPRNVLESLVGSPLTFISFFLLEVYSFMYCCTFILVDYRRDCEQGMYLVQYLELNATNNFEHFPRTMYYVRFWGYKNELNLFLGVKELTVQ